MQTTELTIKVDIKPTIRVMFPEGHASTPRTCRLATRTSDSTSDAQRAGIPRERDAHSRPRLAPARNDAVVLFDGTVTFSVTFDKKSPSGESQDVSVPVIAEIRGRLDLTTVKAPPREATEYMDPNKVLLAWRKGALDGWKLPARLFLNFTVDQRRPRESHWPICRGRHSWPPARTPSGTRWRPSPSEPSRPPTSGPPDPRRPKRRSRHRATAFLLVHQPSKSKAMANRRGENRTRSMQVARLDSICTIFPCFTCSRTMRR